jgi:hypothetical protein
MHSRSCNVSLFGNYLVFVRQVLVEPLPSSVLFFIGAFFIVLHFIVVLVAAFCHTPKLRILCYLNKTYLHDNRSA